MTITLANESMLKRLELFFKTSLPVGLYTGEEMKIQYLKEDWFQLPNDLSGSQSVSDFKVIEAIDVEPHIILPTNTYQTVILFLQGEPYVARYAKKNKIVICPIHRDSIPYIHILAITQEDFDILLESKMVSALTIDKFLERLPDLVKGFHGCSMVGSIDSVTHFNQIEVNLIDPDTYLKVNAEFTVSFKESPTLIHDLQVSIVRLQYPIDISTTLFLNRYLFACAQYLESEFSAILSTGIQDNQILRESLKDDPIDIHTIKEHNEQKQL